MESAAFCHLSGHTYTLTHRHASTDFDPDSYLNPSADFNPSADIDADSYLNPCTEKLHASVGIDITKWPERLCLLLGT